MTFTLAEFRKQVRQAFADYAAAAGCGCCGSPTDMQEALERLGKLLRIPRFDDNSGRDFYRFRSKK